jgi:hypothetical protein
MRGVDEVIFQTLVMSPNMRSSAWLASRFSSANGALSSGHARTPPSSRRLGPSRNWTTKGEDVLHPRLVRGRSLETDTTCHNTAILQYSGSLVCSVLHTIAEFSRGVNTVPALSSATGFILEIDIGHRLKFGSVPVSGALSFCPDATSSDTRAAREVRSENTCAATANYPALRSYISDVV